MTAFRSAPDGYAQVGWRAIAATTAGLWLFPAVPGGIGKLVVALIGADGRGDTVILIDGLAQLALFLPLVTWGNYALIGLGALFLLRRGWFGWASALLLGGFAGYGLALLVADPTVILIGAFLGALFRIILALRAPEAF